MYTHRNAQPSVLRAAFLEMRMSFLTFLLFSRTMMIRPLPGGDGNGCMAKMSDLVASTPRIAASSMNFVDSSPSSVA